MFRAFTARSTLFCNVPYSDDRLTRAELHGSPRIHNIR
jgi:hypothetical protein